MIDIHSHILPAVDDGARDMTEALTMAKMAEQDGITTIIATPHITGKTPGRAWLEDHVSALQRAITAAGIQLKIMTGGEIPFHLKSDFGPFHLGHSNYILLELPHRHVPAQAEQKVYTLQRQGYTVIIAHPERNSDIINNPSLLAELLDCGALAQITADSVTGAMGSSVQHCAHHLLRSKLVHFLASDSHSSLQRKPLLGKALTITAKIIGKKEAHKLVFTNPEKITCTPPRKGAPS